MEVLVVRRYGSAILNLDIRWYVSDQLHDPATSVLGEEHAITMELEAGFDTFFYASESGQISCPRRQKPPILRLPSP